MWDTPFPDVCFSNYFIQCKYYIDLLNNIPYVYTPVDTFIINEEEYESKNKYKFERNCKYMFIDSSRFLDKLNKG